MPIQAPQWTEFLSCPICFNIFDEQGHRPISLGCGHTVCKMCLSKLTPRKCPFDQNSITRDIEELPVNYALLQLVGVAVPESEQALPTQGLAENVEYYNSATKCIEELAMYLKPTEKEPPSASSTQPPSLSRPMQRKLVTLLNCQLIEDEGRARAVRAARSLGERTVTELILQHQNPQQLSANLWAGVRARGCQFLGPAMQEEVLKLILLALEDGSPLSRKVLVLFVVQRLETQYPQASKTAIGHVVQLLYRASCFKVTKREEESSLMQLKEEFCTYEALRREHDSQIVQIATEAGLRISPEQWSSLLYGDTAHKSHMQSIIDKLQTPQSFSQSINELTMALQRTGDPGNLARLKVHLELLAHVDPSADSSAPNWEILDRTMQSIKAIVEGLVEFSYQRTSKKQEFVPLHNPKYKTSMCRDLIQRGKCPRGSSCTFAHSAEELERYRLMSKKGTSAAHLTTPPPLMMSQIKVSTSSALTPQERESLKRVIKSSNEKINNSSNKEPQAVTAELPSGTEDTATSFNYKKAVTSNKAVSVPIAKACSLPTNTRAKMESSIYSLSILTDDKIEDDSLHPGIIPASKKIASLQAHTGQGPQPSPLPGRPPPPQQPQQPQQQLYNPAICQPNVPYRASPPVYTQLRHVESSWPGAVLGVAGSPASGDGSREGDDAGGVTKVPTVTATFVSHNNNLYGVDCYGLNARDRAHYSSLAMRGRGKSPSEQLDELHSRKSELLAQLNKTRTKIKDSKDGDSKSDDNQDIEDTESPAPAGSWDNGFLSTTKSLLDLNEVSSAMLHHLGLSEQLVCPETQSLQGHLAQALLPVSQIQFPMKLSTSSSLMTTICSSLYNCEDAYKTQSPASTYNTNSLTQKNLHIQAMEDTSNRDEEFISWSSGDEIAELMMSRASLQDELVYSDAKGEKADNQTWDPDWDVDDNLPGLPVSDELDEFVPFNENYCTSKYGPISRMVKTKLRQQEPVQVTAGQMVFNHSGSINSPYYQNNGETQPVNAVTPMQRPYPVTSQVPSRFLPQDPGGRRPSMSPWVQTLGTSPSHHNSEEENGHLTKKTESPESREATEASQKELLRNPQAQKGGHRDHKPDPYGYQVAASLPTALLQPNVLARANKDSEPHTLWMLRQRMSSQVPQTSFQPHTPDNLRSEIADLNSKIEHLQSSEDERLVRELQAIELSIVQAEKQIQEPSPVPVHTGVPTPTPVYAVNNKVPVNGPARFPDHRSAATNVYGSNNVVDQHDSSASARGRHLDRNLQYTQSYYLGGQGVDYLMAREAQKLEISRRNAKVIQESSDRLYAEDIAKREMEKYVRSSNE